MERKLQVFVSSTYLDMRQERQAAVEAILQAGHIPAGMELFAAGDASQWETIRQWIDDSDVYMLILGGRYGTIEATSGKSYIQLEYEYAFERHKPVFAAVIDEGYLKEKVKGHGAEVIETDNGHLYKQFKESVTKKICRFFQDLNGLKVIVFESLGRLSRVEELTGWVRGSEIANMKSTMEELNRLQAENVSLRSRLAVAEELSAGITITGRPDPEDLGDDAKQLLRTIHSGGGVLYYRETAVGSHMSVKREILSHPDADMRIQARWKAAMQELERSELIEQLSNENWRLTKLGFDFGDVLREADAT